MIYEQEINKLKSELSSLRESFLQSQRNQVSITAKTDNTVNKVVQITPYTNKKTAYIEDTEIIFTEVPQGNLSVYMQDSEGNYPNFTVERSGDRVTVSFEALEQVTTVTISIL